MRLFIAITLSNKLKARIGEAQQRILSQVSGGRFTDRDNLHLTLHFLGQIDENRVHSLQTAMDQIAMHSSPFYLNVDDIGHFTKKNKKILFFGVKGATDELQSLHQSMAHALTGLGFEVEQRPYTPHITLARQVRADKPIHIESLDDRFVVSGITLMHSTRVDGRLTYVPIYRSAFHLGELIVERIEGSIALLENIGGDSIKAATSTLPHGISEGSVIIKDNGDYTLDLVRTNARQQRIDQRLDSLKKRS